jgi:hypothetical protein
LKFLGSGWAQVVAFGLGLLKLNIGLEAFLNLGPYNGPENMLKFILKIYYTSLLTKSFRPQRPNGPIGLCPILRPFGFGL